MQITAWSSGFESASATSTMVNYAASSNVNAIMPEVRLRGDAYYASTLEPPGTGVAPSPAGYDSLADCIAKAHPLGIEVHPWVVTYRIWTTTTGPGHTTPEHLWWTHGPGNTDPAQDWMMYSDTGAWDYSGTVSLDPGHPAVQDYLVTVFMDIVNRYDVDGLNLDYLRYPGTNWGYNPASVQRFNAEYGRSGNPSPGDTTWQNWRRDQITNLVKRLYLEIKAVKPQVKLSADVWNSWSTGNATYLQDWNSWMQNHWIDFVHPMLYTSNNTTYHGWLDDAVNRQYGRHVYPLVDASLGITANVLPQIDLVRQHGFPGLGLYAYNSIPDKPALQSALTGGPFPTAVPPADMPWLTAPTLGMLKGHVLNASGNAIYPATVTIQSRSTKNTGTGFYGFVDLATGTYTVSASAPGYLSSTGQVTLTVGQVATLDLALGTDTTPPSTPTNLAATPVSGTQVNLTWTASTDNVGVTGYKVFRDGAQIGASATASYSDSTCAPATTYTYTVSAYDAAGNESAQSTVAVARTPGVKNYAPTSITLTRGTVSSGSVTNLAANDSSYLVITAQKVGGTRYVDWYSSVTIAEAPASITRLTITFDGKLSASQTQVLYLYNWSTSSWTQFDSRTVGNSDVTVTWSTSSPASYISSTGQIRLRQYVTRSSSFTSSSDLSQFKVEY